MRPGSPLLAVAAALSLLVLLLASAAWTPAAALDVQCPAQSPTYVVCAESGNVMLALDTSSGMSQLRYQNTLEWLKSFYCHLQPRQMGLVFYWGVKAKQVIPFQAWTYSGWWWALENLKGQNYAYCCQGRRPWMDALKAAYGPLRLKQNPHLVGDRTVLFLANGLPGQTKYAGHYPWPKISEAMYTYKLIPDMATSVRSQGVRIAFNIIAQDTGSKSSTFNYIAGQFNSTAKSTTAGVLCSVPPNSIFGVKSCTQAGSFPLASLPITTNVFYNSSFNFGALCSVP